MKRKRTCIPIECEDGRIRYISTRAGKGQYPMAGVRYTEQRRVTGQEVERARAAGELDDVDELPVAPETRGECPDQRPCPFVSCRYHLLLGVTASGSVVFQHGHDDPFLLRETCSLDVAERGSASLYQVGHCLGLTRERIRQIEASALKKIKEEAPWFLDAVLDGGFDPEGF